MYLLREEGATHVGCATDRVIESFRNEMYPGYKSSAGMPPELLAQFPIAEAAIEALGVVLWPMVEFEADDAIAAACRRFTADPSVEQVLICTPDHLRRCGGPGQVGRCADLHPGLAGARRRLLGRLSGPARLGRQVRGRGPVPVRPPRGHPREGLALGRGQPARRARSRRHAPRADGECTPVPIAREAADGRGRRGDPGGLGLGAGVARRAQGAVGGVLRFPGSGASPGSPASVAGREPLRARVGRADHPLLAMHLGGIAGSREGGTYSVEVHSGRRAARPVSSPQAVAAATGAGGGRAPPASASARGWGRHVQPHQAVLERSVRRVGVEHGGQRPDEHADAGP
ncbi:MAG: polymerase [Chloroflexi bacterium]|nr:polymerase [Chloroflexota bacterium]